MAPAAGAAVSSGYATAEPWLSLSLIWRQRVATGVRSGLVFPRADRKPWRLHDWKKLVTLGTYAHVIRQVKGDPIVSAEEQIERARQELRGRLRDVEAPEADA